jgi:transposase-like protein
MPRGAADDEEWGEDEEEPTISCPYCGAEIHEDAQRCPYCENYVSEEDTPPSRKPWWLLVGVLLCLYAVYRWIAG